MSNIERVFPPEVVSAALADFADWAELYELEEWITLHPDLPGKPETTIDDIQNWADLMNDVDDDRSELSFIREPDEQKIIAMMVARTDTSLSPHGAIDALSVDPSYQGNGLGSELIESAIQLAKDKQLRSIELKAPSHRRRMYRRLGFVSLRRDGAMRYIVANHS